MNIFVCLDDNSGISFFGKRQSRDAAVCRRILEIAGEKSIYMTEYSKKLFDVSSNIVVCDSTPLDENEDSFYFCEAELPDFENAKKIYVFRWNRIYPSDLRLQDDVFSDFNLEERFDFKGNSHDRITLDVYRRK